MYNCFSPKLNMPKMLPFARFHTSFIKQSVGSKYDTALILHFTVVEENIMIEMTYTHIQTLIALFSFSTTIIYFFKHKYLYTWPMCPLNLFSKP